MRAIRFLFALGLCAMATMAAPPADKLLWSDEFSGPAGTKPDRSKWTYDLGASGWGNQELEDYTQDAQNASLDGNGHLVIRARKEADGRFTSARLKTQGLFSVTYGRIEARLKLPRTQGMWPAFWMLGDNVKTIGWPDCGEIDIMESLGREPAIVHGTVHGPGYSGKDGITAQYTLPGAPPLADDFHVYATDWAPGKIDFSIDGHVYSTVKAASLPPGTKWVFNHPFFLLLNLAVGGNWPGNPDASTVFPQDYLIDCVRVYERKPVNSPSSQ